MPKESSPAYQRYPKDYLSDKNVQVMTLEEEGCYNRLMDYCWLEGSLPNNPEELAALCKGKNPSVRVVNCFTVSGDVLIHLRLEEERAKQRLWIEKSRKAGYKSAAKRWGFKKKEKDKVGYPLVKEWLQPNCNIAVCSSHIANKNASHSILPKRSHRVPEGFTVTDQMREWASKEYPGVDITMETRLFQDHYFKAPRSDWETTWQNWIKKSAGWQPNGSGPKQAAKQQKAAMSDDDFNFDGEGLK